MASKNTPQNPTPQQKATDSKPSADTKPNPARFNDYTVLPDQSGFRIPNCDHIFEFDAYGGWYDEYDNYYNADGKPATPPEDVEDDSYGYDEAADALAREYDQYDDDEDEEHLTHYDNIYLNVENKRVLANYLKDQEINIEIKSMNYNMTENEFENFLKSKKLEWIEFEFEYDNRDRFRGICYITLDKTNAEKLIEFNGARVGGRDIKMNVLKPEEDEEHDAHVGGDLSAVTQAAQKKEEQKTQWRAPVEKQTEQTTASTEQPQGKPESEKANQPQTSGIERNQGQNQNRQQQGQGQNYQGQGNQGGYGQKQNYQGNKGQNQYQRQGQGQGQSGGYQRNYQGQNQQGQNYQGQRNAGGYQKNQYQGQGQYQQNQYQQQQFQQGQYQQGQNYQGPRNTGYPGQQQYAYQYPQQQGFPQQYNYGAPTGNYPVQGYPQYNYGATQGQYPQQFQYQNPQYQQQGQPQTYQAAKPSGPEQPPVQSGPEEDVSGAWGKPLNKKKKEQEK